MPLMPDDLNINADGDGDFGGEDAVGSPSVSAEDVGLVPSALKVSGAWFVLICGSFITIVTIVR